jgi:hypothetical protein
MNRTPTSPRVALRQLLPLLATGASVIGLAACGDDSSTADQPTGPPSTVAPPDSVDPTTMPPTTAPGFEHPTGADQVVVEIAYEGGLLHPDVAFGELPVLLVSGDARQFVLGPQIEIYPQPLLPNVLVGEIGEEGIQALLDLAAEHGLLTEREYERNDMIADAADTVVRISANGDTFEHRAYALGLDAAETGDRAELQAFVAGATAELAIDETAFEPQNYLLRATPIEDVSGYDTEPTLVDWPATSSLLLAGAGDCVEVPAESVHDLLAAANQLTFFVQDDVVYQVTAKPQLPGDAC